MGWVWVGHKGLSKEGLGCMCGCKVGYIVGVIMGCVASNYVRVNFGATAESVVGVSVAPNLKKLKKSLYNKYIF